MEKIYKLVILGETWDLYKIAYQDLLNGNVKYISGFCPQNIIFKLLFKLHCSRITNSRIKLPFKYLWNHYLLNKIEKNSPIVFLLFKGWLSVESEIKWIDYIRSNFKNSRIVLFLQDIISTYVDYFSGDPIDISFYKDKVDLIISFDRKDALKYGLAYHTTVLSHLPINSTKNRSDVFFIGKSKGRIDILIKIYNKLTGLGLKCLFIILDSSKKESNSNEGIKYIDKQLPYSEVLEYVQNTRCLLEILQPGAIGATYRTLEAITYGKRLLTNNLSLINEEIFDGNYMSLFNNIEDIDDAFFQNLDSPVLYDKHLKELVSPKNLISDIEQHLDISIEY